MKAWLAWTAVRLLGHGLTLLGVYAGHRWGLEYGAPITLAGGSLLQQVSGGLPRKPVVPVFPKEGE